MDGHHHFNGVAEEWNLFRLRLLRLSESDLHRKCIWQPTLQILKFPPAVAFLEARIPAKHAPDPGTPRTDKAIRAGPDQFSRKPKQKMLLRMYWIADSTESTSIFCRTNVNSAKVQMLILEIQHRKFPMCITDVFAIRQ
jgi:hypothetical protein